MSKALLVDFDTLDGQRDFEALRPIGVILEIPGGPGVEMRYLDSVTDGEDVTGVDNYERTLLALEEYLQQWRSGGDAPSARGLLVYLADQSYPGLRFRNISEVADELTLGEAFQRFVVDREPIPQVPDAELSDV